VTAEVDHLRAVASSDTNWELAWEHGIEPIKQAALQSLKSDVWAMDEELAEDSFTFRAAMVMLASYMVGPYTVRVATFLGYPVGFVQVIAARLIESGIWAGDEVSSETWLDPEKGMRARPEMGVLPRLHGWPHLPRATERFWKNGQPRECPDCGHIFKGQGWDGIDAHWKTKHETSKIPYREFWEGISSCLRHRQ
jgi:hypothetical protein